MELLEPVVTLETIKGKKTLRTRTLPIEKLKISSTKLPARGVAQGVVGFKSDTERDADQVFRLWLARKDAADKPVKVTLF